MCCSSVMRNFTEIERDELRRLGEWMTTYKQVEPYFIWCILLCGLSGNLISIMVFTSTTLKKLPSSVYLFALSLVDSVFLLSLVPISLEQLGVNIFAQGFLCYIMVYTSYVTSFLSVWFVTLFMIERYIVVCHPLKAAYLCSRKRSILCVIILTVLSLTIYSYTLRGVAVTLNNDNQTFLCTLDEKYLGTTSMFNYIDTTLSFIIPFTAILCFNMRVIIAIRSVRKDKYLLHSCSRSHTLLPTVQLRLTSTLIIVSLTFLTLLLPSHVVRLCIVFLKRKAKRIDIPMGVMFKKLQSVVQPLSYLNYCANFAIYSASSQLFRNGIIQLLKRIQGRVHVGPRESLIKECSVNSERRSYMETHL